MIKKATGLMTSRPQIAEHMHQCPGCPRHKQVAGRLKSGQLLSDFVAAYTPKFCVSVLQQLSDAGVAMPSSVHELQYAELDVDCLAAEEPVDDQHNQQGDNKVKSLSISCIRTSTAELVRLLKHSKASEQAIQAAEDLQCSVCVNHVRPASAHPANVPRCVDFNHQLGLDVKHMPGWKPNQSIPCVSLVDYGTSLHVCATIFEREAAELLKGVLRDSWISWAGAPEYLITDPAKLNVSDALSTFCESLGIKQLQTATEAHYQLGKVERHGQWFEQILARMKSALRLQKSGSTV